MDLPAPSTEIGLVRSDDWCRGLHHDLEDLCEEFGVTLVAGEEGAVGTAAELVVAVGDDALTTVGRRDLSTPILPVECGPGVPSASITDVPAVVRSILETGGRASERATLAVSVDETVERALFDVALVTDGPARISEYSVRSGREIVARLRADGIVVATPAGSSRYASAAGGPTVDGAVECAVVVPIAPFVTQRKRWVLSPNELSVTVERDDCAVSLQVDGTVRASVDAESTVAFDAGPPVSIVDDDSHLET